MLIKGIITDDTVNYKKISLTIMMPKCDFKCDKECGLRVCQNSQLASQNDINIKDINVFLDKYYFDDTLENALVFQGLEPFDTWEDLLEMITCFRSKSDDDIVIYTGYREEEITDKVMELKKFSNIIIKFGRFVPDKDHHIDELLSVELASPNQYAKRIS